MTISTISVNDMHCSSCEGRIRRALSPLTGISATHINPVHRHVLVEHGTDTDPLEIMNRIESAGFTPTLFSLDNHDERQKTLLKRLGIAGLAMMQVMMVSTALYAGAFDGMDRSYEQLLRYTGLVFTIPVICYSAVPFFTNAIGSLRSLSGLSMDVPIALAISIAFLTSLHTTISGVGEVYYDSVVMFTFLLLGARYIDNRLQRRFDLTGHLLAALPRTAERENSGSLETIPIAELAVGDLIWINEGAQVPVDGVLLSKRAAVDEALLTGESLWAQKQPQEAVYAGTLNRGAGFRMKATRSFDRSRIADIAQLAEQAELQRAGIVQLADRVAGVFVPVVLGLATATFIGWQIFEPERAISAVLAVLVVSCPCALSLATPAALTAAMTRLRQIGIVLTSSSALERAAVVDTVFIDKTGTLTMDVPQIASVELLDSGLTRDRCLSIAAALQRHSSHPYARAFAEQTRLALVTGVTTVPGSGVEGLLDGIPVRIGSAAYTGAHAADDRAAYLSISDVLVARFDFTDRLRPDARAALDALRQMGVEPLMLSGDSAERCARTAQELNIRYEARQSPEAKLEVILREQQLGQRVLMLGDGINDIPVLAGADLSAAVLEATDLVKSKADVLLLSRRIGPLAAFIRMARATRKVIHQNLVWALLYNLTAIPIAAMGLMPPWMAALGMASSSTLVMLNAMRLLKVPADQPAMQA